MLLVDEISKSTTVRLVKRTRSSSVLSMLADDEEGVRILEQNRIGDPGDLAQEKAVGLMLVHGDHGIALLTFPQLSKK